MARPLYHTTRHCTRRTLSFVIRLHYLVQNYHHIGRSKFGFWVMNWLQKLAQLRIGNRSAGGSCPAQHLTRTWLRNWIYPGSASLFHSVCTYIKRPYSHIPATRLKGPRPGIGYHWIQRACPWGERKLRPRLLSPLRVNYRKRRSIPRLSPPCPRMRKAKRSTSLLRPRATLTSPPFPPSPHLLHIHTLCIMYGKTIGEITLERCQTAMRGIAQTRVIAPTIDRAGTLRRSYPFPYRPSL